MFSETRAPSLLPKYATDYVIHKKALYIDGVGNFFFDQKKALYPSVPFYIGSYKFSEVKSAPEFVKELEYFKFGETSFHRNDSEDKVVNYCVVVGVHFEYVDYWDKDEEIFRNARNITALRKRFKRTIMTVGGKGKAIK